MAQSPGMSSSPLRYGGGLSSPMSASSAMIPRTPLGSTGSRRGELNGRSHAVSRPLMSSSLHEQSVVWGTTVDVGLAMAQFRDFVLQFIDERTGAPKYPALISEMKTASATAIGLDCRDLHSWSTTLYQQLVTYPQEMVPAFDLVINDMLEEMRADLPPQPVQVRPYNLLQQQALRCLDPIDLDKIVAIRGMVIRVGPILPDMASGMFRCHVCQADTVVAVDRGAIAQPVRCASCQTRDSLQIQHNRCEFSDKQLLRVQEAPESIPEGEAPQTVDVYAFNDLVDLVRPGDRVTITGIFRAVPVRSSSKKRTVSSVYKTYIDGIHFKATDVRRLALESDARLDQDDGAEVEAVIAARHQQLQELGMRHDIYDLLTASIAPSIWGHEDVKRGLLCQLFGGANKEFSQSGTGRFRGEINVLLCGDPGTAKSQLLQYVHSIAPRGIFTSGKGSSAVGLTAYVTRDPITREFVMESGALVLSDQGICCIDEFDKMSPTTRSILHEVMEQQTVSVAKAGIIATLNARTAVLAAANPLHSRYDPNLSVVENIQLPPTLLSRFDLVYLILDAVSDAPDRRLAQHLISMYYSEDERSEEARIETIPIDLVTSYISYAREHVTPTLSDDAAHDLIQGYVRMRSLGQTANRSIITATPRQLDSLIRLSEALAKMKLSHTVESEHVKEALRLMDVSTGQSATDPKTGLVDMDTFMTGMSTSKRIEVATQAAVMATILKEMPTPTIRAHMLLRKYNESLPEDAEQLQSSGLWPILNHLADQSAIRIQQRQLGDNCEVRRLE
uniref:DNA replication licensing factor MCM4 n=1 Tax=Spongospora subterranea TaxID=70186 RepID=A0A0H5R7Z9_9EUKA|eukprot:CRZ09946.1 hypothetical protein [Spongospora subterranea]